LIATAYERRLARVQIFLAGLQSASELIAEIAAIKPSDTALWWIEYFAGMKSERLVFSQLMQLNFQREHQGRSNKYFSS
jgi:hypothetical protein